MIRYNVSLRQILNKYQKNQNNPFLEFPDSDIAKIILFSCPELILQKARHESDYLFKRNGCIEILCKKNTQMQHWEDLLEQLQ